MLPKQNRLKKKKDFEKIFKQGRGFIDDFLFLKIIRNNLKNSRFGFIISKKFSNKATLRNKIKRKLREIIHLQLPQITKGIDVVLLVRPGLETKDFWEIEESVRKILIKANIIKKKKTNV